MYKNYVYIYLNPLKPGIFTYGKFSFEYEPFYIGKGVSNRFKVHIIQSKKDKNSLKLNTIRKIIKSGTNPIIIKLYENITDVSSLRMERYLIKLIGRRNLKLGPLSNLTNGGEGPSGQIISKETRNKISNKLKKQYANGILISPFTKKGRIPHNKGQHGKYVAWNKGLEFSQSTKDKIAKSLTGLKQSDEIINKRRKTNKERYDGVWNKGLKTGVPAHNIRAVIKLDLDCNPIQEYKSVKEARDNNPTAMTIIRVCNGKNIQSGGFKWKWK